MWLLVGGRGGEIDISMVAKKICSVPRETGTQVWFKRGRWTVDDEASCISQTRRCTKIFYITSHTILASKLFVVYLIFHYVLKDKMVLRRERMVFELLEHLRTVNMQLVHECRAKFWNYSRFVWHFYALIEFLGI